VVDLDHRAKGVVAVLVVAAADRQQMIERQANLALPEASMGAISPVVSPKSMRGLARSIGSPFSFQRLAPAPPA
jgi:hypothetical protein